MKRLIVGSIKTRTSKRAVGVLITVTGSAEVSPSVRVSVGQHVVMLDADSADALAIELVRKADGARALMRVSGSSR